MKVVKIVLLSVFCSIGLIFLLVAFITGTIDARNTANAVEINGVIETLDKRHGMPIVSYVWEGEEYVMRAHTYSSAMRVGDPYPVLIDPSNPSNPTDHTLRLLSIIFGSIGAVFSAAGLIVFKVLNGIQRKREELLTYGRRVSATITAVETNYVVRINRRHPYQIVAECRHPMTGETVSLRSHNLMTTTAQPGDHVDVLFDPNNNAKYIFDVQEGL